MYATVA